jgi:adenosylcobinamide kinase/adenosylcobinamide-phosphate guanylyltransferase
MEQLARNLLDACREFGGTVFLVTNEVGMGIVPENALARRFRDLAGRCNQVVAAGADGVTLVVSGLPMHLKGKDAGQ